MLSLKRIFVILLAAFLTLSAAACDRSSNLALPEKPSGGPTETATQPATPTHQRPTALLSPSPAASPTPEPPQKAHYSLQAILDYDQHQLEVDQKIRYINNSTDPLSELILMVDALYYPGTFQLINLAWEDGQAISDIKQESGWLHFQLQQPLNPGDAIELAVQYRLTLPTPTPSAAIRPIPFGHTDRQTNLVDWYPFVPPYISGKGWLANPASYYGEHLAYESADFDVSLRLASPRPDLTIAASAPAVQDGEWQRFTHQNARNFVWSISPYYQTLSAQAGPVKVTAYAFQSQEQANQAVLDTTVAALELYSRLFGPYPRETLTVVEADFLDGMEYDGLYFLSKGFYNLYTGTPGEYLVAIAAHETAHQWFYALVGNDQALEPWLDEALCTYSENLFYENIHPEALDWWWTYRVNYYQPRGWVDTSIYNPHGDQEPYRSYRDAVYLNGAVFFDELRKTIGETEFFAFLKTYIAQNQNQVVKAEDFFSLLLEISSGDLEDLLKNYFYSWNQRIGG